MSLKSNFEYIRDWCNAKFLKKTDQIDIDLSKYATKKEIESELKTAGAWELESPNSDYSGVHLKNNNGTADGDFSVSEGYNTSANGTNSHAEGYYTSSSGIYSHAEGSHTTASGYISHAEGNYTTASESYTHAEGDNTIASNAYEHAQGTYNLSNSGTVFSHGIGGGSNSRKNAIEIMSNGNCFIYGVGGYNGTNPTADCSIQTVLNNVVKLDDYQDDEEVIAAALNDLNSRLAVPKITSTITLPSDSTPLNITSYVTWNSDTSWKVKNGFEKRIMINDNFWDYGTYNGYTGHFYIDSGNIYVMNYDSVNDMFAITKISS